jgi:hypothetical protein
MTRPSFFTILVALLTTSGRTAPLTAQTPLAPLIGPAVLDDWGNRFTSLGASVPENALRTHVRTAIAQLAMFDAVNAVLDGPYRPFASKPVSASGASPDAAAIRAAYIVALNEFPTKTLEIDSAYQRGAGGPIALSRQRFYIGINDVLNPGFDRLAFTLFDAWRNLPSSGRDAYTNAREAIARGQEIFNTRIFTIENVPGVNDRLGVAALPGTCTTCHNTPNVGNHSTSLPLDLGLTAAAVRTPDLPLYTFRNRTTGEVFQTTDPGRALVTGKWKDMALFKGPILRGLAARAPYFHNGFAATLLDVVEFYDMRFNIGLTAQEKAELVAFLNAL